jgi:hypothetical protein
MSTPSERLSNLKSNAAYAASREHPALSRLALGTYAESCSSGNVEAKIARLENFMAMVPQVKQTEFAPVVIPNGVAEMFGYRLAEFAGVRVPRVSLTTEEPSAADCLTNYVKPVLGGWMLSERVPRSMPLYYLETQVPTGLTAVTSDIEDIFVRVFESLFDKRCPLGPEAYADFP